MINFYELPSVKLIKRDIRTRWLSGSVWVALAQVAAERDLDKAISPQPEYGSIKRTVFKIKPRKKRTSLAAEMPFDLADKSGSACQICIFLVQSSGNIKETIFHILMFKTCFFNSERIFVCDFTFRIQIYIKLCRKVSKDIIFIILISHKVLIQFS